MKTEKEKMLAGEIYDPADEELSARWQVAKQLMLEYNNARRTERNKLERIYRRY